MYINIGGLGKTDRDAYSLHKLEQHFALCSVLHTPYCTVICSTQITYGMWHSLNGIPSTLHEVLIYERAMNLISSVWVIVSTGARPTALIELKQRGNLINHSTTLRILGSP